ncbi:probable multidrug resistance-associated protein lethal(2)03659 [Anthonomus grandis grandis]|uniref:probable multidrug resistance-associated protein lethal(2)03659 n=1 Tax=Anthonomus grandis grandis TaxID=2921223 RepID=UPI0021656C95|nr:probable multidrug resistance-associated protein lethal(2)03659 [Anthonomus grandis grandis]
MDHVGQVKRGTNPREKANVFSLLTFTYTGPLFTRSLKKDLEEDDVYDVIKPCQAKKNGDKFERVWRTRREQGKTALFPVLWTVFGWNYLLLGLTNLIWKLLISILEPQAISKLVSYFNPRQTTITFEEAVFYACVKIGLRVIHGLYVQNYVLYVQHLAIKLRTSFCSLVYRKSLKLTPAALNEISLGNVITVITKDVMVFEHNMMMFNDMWVELIKLVVVCYLIYNKMGWTGFVGVAVMFVIVPAQIWVAKCIKNLRLDLSQKTDQRLQTTQETLSAIKIIKMYTWEKVFSAKVEERRRLEMTYLMKAFYLRSANFILGMLTSKVGFYVLIMTYIAVNGTIDADVVFYVMKCFGDIRGSVTMLIPLGLGRGAELYASYQRINKILKCEELDEKHNDDYDKPKVVLKNATVRIKEQTILSDISMKLKRGLTIVSGPLGCGKSSLLKLFLKDFPVTEGKVYMRGSFSYSSQDPWLFPSSIKQNITFGQPYDETRYKEVVKVCALQYDFDLFEKGDETIVADRGINLSGGQQARVNLARAIYKKSEIYLLDDPLHALDPNVQDYIFQNCIQGFLKDKIVVLVTHNLRHKNCADHLILLNNGQIQYEGRPTEVKVDLVKEVTAEQKQEHEEEQEEEDEEINEKTKMLKQEPSKKKVYSEVKKTGKVDLTVYKKYFSFGGGFFMFLAISSLFIGAEFSDSYSAKLLTNWIKFEQNVTNMKAYPAEMSKETNESLVQLESQADTTLKIYSAMIFGSVLLDLIKQGLFINFARKASINLHNEMIEKLTTGSMSFFDNYFIGNILNRFSQDLTKIDEHLPHTINHLTRVVLAVAGVVGLVTSVSWTFLIPATILVTLMIIMQRLYIPAARSLKRLESATRSPLIGHLNATMEGITTVRAFKLEKLLTEEFDRHQDLYTSAHYMSFCVRRAFDFFMEILSTIFVSTVIGKLLFFNSGEPGADVGLAITKASQLALLVQWALMQLSDLENNMTSVERVLEYTEVPQDDYEGETTPNWPSKGAISYKAVTLTYKAEQVLRGVSFDILPRQKIGIVGRTGAGKSSLISTLFRLYNFDGTITIDGVDTKRVALSYLRNHISIIPQEPLLFQGTIRENIDPYDRYSDDEIWDTLEKVHMRDHIHNLDLKITDHGSNFSTGQRQLICLARVIIKRNKIVVLDEATANMDPETEILAQQAIEKHFDDSTVLIIAHRLQAVLQCDKIIVMDKGRIVEFDDPHILLANKQSHFSKMLAIDSAQTFNI